MSPLVLLVLLALIVAAFFLLKSENCCHRSRRQHPSPPSISGITVCSNSSDPTSGLLVWHGDQLSMYSAYVMDESDGTLYSVPPISSSGAGLFKYQIQGATAMKGPYTVAITNMNTNAITKVTSIPLSSSCPLS